MNTGLFKKVLCSLLILGIVFTTNAAVFAGEIEGSDVITVSQTDILLSDSLESVDEFSVEAEPEITVTEPAEPESEVSMETEPEEAVTEPVEPEEAVTEPAEPEEAVTEPAEPVTDAFVETEIQEAVTELAEPEGTVPESIEPVEFIFVEEEPEEEITEPAEPEEAVTESAEPEEFIFIKEEPEEEIKEPDKQDETAAEFIESIEFIFVEEEPEEENTEPAEPAEIVTEPAEPVETDLDSVELFDLDSVELFEVEPEEELSEQADVPALQAETELVPSEDQDEELLLFSNETDAKASEQTENTFSLTNEDTLEEPAGLSASGTQTGILFQWNAVAGASGYIVYRWNPVSNKWEQLTKVTGKTEYEDTTVTPSKDYYYTVRAYKGTVKSTYNKYGVIGVYVAPVQITGLTTDGTNITLKWEKSTGADGYRICWRYKGSTSWKKWKDVTTASFTEDVANTNKAFELLVVPYKSYQGITYYAQIDNNGKSVCSVFTAPKLQSAKSTSQGITLTWDASAGATGYTLYYWSAKAKAWRMFAFTTDTEYTDTTAKAGNRYYYTVQAYSDTGISGYGNSWKAALYLPSVPFTSAQATADGITCSWNSLDGADGYVVYWRYQGTSKWKYWTYTSETSVTDPAKSLKSNRTYEYMIWPYVLKGETPYFGTWDESCKASVLWVDVPVLESAKPVTNGIEITWNSVSGAVSYDIFWWHPTQKKWKKFASTAGTSYVDTTAKYGKIYGYTVCARTAAGAGAYDNNGLTAARLSAANINDMKYTGSAVEFSWDPAAGATGYSIYWRKPGGEWKYLKDVTDTSYTDKTAKQGETYEYGVWAYIKKGVYRCYGEWNDGSWEQITAVLTDDSVLEAVSLRTGIIYSINSPLKNMSMDVLSGSTADGAYVRVYTSNQTGAQMWVIQGTDQDGYFVIRNIKSWNCLTVSGEDIVQRAFSGSSSQLWTILPTGDEDGTCYIVNKNGQYLRVAAGGDISTSSLTLSSESGAAAEKFTFVPAGQGTGVDYSVDGVQYIGFRSFAVDDGTVSETDGYYPIVTSIDLPSGGYDLTTANIGLKVMYVNTYLASAGYLGSNYYNYNRYDSNTAYAVQQFQANHGLNVDGVVGINTWLAMGYSTADWYGLGTYITPLKVSKYASSRTDYIEAMLATAAEYASSGTGFKDGASGQPGTYVDCSGLIYQCLYSAGINPYTNIVDHAYAVYEYTSRYLAADSRLGQVVSSAQRGDLIFYGSGGVVNHVAISAGNGLIYDSWPGIGVTLRSQYSPGTILKIIRPF